MGFFVVLMGMAMAWVLFAMPVFGLACLALSLVFWHLHRRYLRRTEDAPPKKWRKLIAVILAILAGLNLLGGAAGWIFMLVTGA